MASKRCINIDFYNSDCFLSLPHSTMVLYTFLVLAADDYGIVSNPKTIMRISGTSDEDMSKLIIQKYVLEFDTGKIVIADWLVHNNIQPSKLTVTQNNFEMKKLLVINDINKYIFSSDNVSEIERQYGDVSPPQYKTSKDKTREDNLSEDNSIKRKHNICDEENERELSKGEQSEDYSQEIREIEKIRRNRGII